MGTRIRFLSWVVFCVFFTGALAADERPTLGELVHAKDDIGLTYSCLPNYETGDIDCEFSQVLIKRKLEPSDFESELQKFVADFSRTPEELAQFCRMIEKRWAEVDWDAERAKARSNEDFDDQMKVSSFMLEFCANPSDENIRKMAKSFVSNDVSTCIVKVNTWKNTFSKTAGGDWIAFQPPHGNCLISKTSLFEKHEQKFTDDGPPLVKWRFIDRKTVMDKSAKSEAGIGCSDWVEEEQVYVESQSLLMNCKRLEIKHFWM